MTFDEMQTAIVEARYAIRTSDQLIGTMASLIAGRLRKSIVTHSVLVSLKKELRDFNMTTGEWKNK